ncbi:MAG: hypothetical protein OEZ54_04105, partial [Gemmatimonadota bacterium]|nr:hypothetical protein [Gemmatimonadota bacterium]
MKPSPPDTGWVGNLWPKITIPRPPGSEGVKAAQSAVAKHLSDAGWTVEWQDFTTSPKRLYGVSVGATGLGWLALLSFPLMVG